MKTGIRAQAAITTLSVRGLLSETLLAAFPTLSAEAQGTETALTGTLADQAALYGVLAQRSSRSDSS